MDTNFGFYPGDPADGASTICPLCKVNCYSSSMLGSHLLGMHGFSTEGFLAFDHYQMTSNDHNIQYQIQPTSAIEIPSNPILEFTSLENVSSNAEESHFDAQSQSHFDGQSQFEMENPIHEYDRQFPSLESNSHHQQQPLENFQNIVKEDPQPQLDQTIHSHDENSVVNAQEGEREVFECAKCFARFSSKSKLKCHFRNHQETFVFKGVLLRKVEEGWPCPLCPWHNPSVGSMRTHLNRHHPTFMAPGWCPDTLGAKFSKKARIDATDMEKLAPVLQDQEQEPVQKQKPSPTSTNSTITSSSTTTTKKADQIKLKPRKGVKTSPSSSSKPMKKTPKRSLSTLDPLPTVTLTNRPKRNKAVVNYNMDDDEDENDDQVVDSYLDMGR